VTLCTPPTPINVQREIPNPNQIALQFPDEVSPTHTTTHRRTEGENAMKRPTIWETTHQISLNKLEIETKR
jgi:hypothetical protein